MDTGQGKPATASAAGQIAVQDAHRTPLTVGFIARIKPWARRYRSVVIVAGGTALVLAGQLAEDVADGGPLQMLPPTLLVQRWTVVVATLYMLASVEFIRRVVGRSAGVFPHVVRIDAARLRTYIARMRQPTAVVDVALLALSAAIVVLLFVIQRIDLPVTGGPQGLPGDALTAFLVLAGYTIIGWAGLRVVVGTIRAARVLRALSHEPLEVNVFDTTNLLPFGNAALAIAMAPALVIVILLLGLGQPSTPLGWTVLSLAALASILSLLLPLRVIHGKMFRTKLAALERLNDHIRGAHDTVLGPHDLDATGISALSDRTATLIALRKTVQEMTTWPFRDTVTFGRAVLIASAPIVYTVLSELILRVF